MKKLNTLFKRYKKLFCFAAITYAVIDYSHTSFDNFVYAEEMKSNSETQSSSHERSVQKLYAVVYDQDTNEYLGRFLLATQVGYTDSPHRMFDADGINPVHINGYAFIGNPSAMVPVDWKNKSGVTEVKWVMVKTSSDSYKKAQKALDKSTNNEENNEDSTETQTPKLNEDGLQVDNDGNVNLHDIYHAYMSFLGHPLPTDSAGYQPTARALYLFQKYLGYDPSKSKEENYKLSTSKQSSDINSSSQPKTSSSISSSKQQSLRKKTSIKKSENKAKSSSNLKPILGYLSLGLIGLLVILVIKRLKLK